MGMEIIDFKATKCKHCYKCVRYCGVKAIQVKDERAVIMPDKCILCGHCLKICPQSAKTLKSDLNMVRGFLREGMRVVVSIAPSYMGLLKYKTIGQVRGALLRLGFEDVRETSEGAAFVTAEYARLLAEHKMENIITTCCPSANDLVEIYYPQLIPYLAPVVSPMIAHGKLLKEELGRDVKVVFLGPCIAKKKEAMDLRHEGYIDAVLNFNDINKWLEEEDIVIEDCEDRPFTAFDPKVNRLYPVTNGVVNSVLATEEKGDGYRKFYVHGEDNCIDLCKSMSRGEIKGCFIEMNMCTHIHLDKTAFDFTAGHTLTQINTIVLPVDIELPVSVPLLLGSQHRIDHAVGHGIQAVYLWVKCGKWPVFTVLDYDVLFLQPFVYIIEI